MGRGAQTPEELETLLEDAFVVHDRAALAALFEPGARTAAGSMRSRFWTQVTQPKETEMTEAMATRPMAIKGGEGEARWWFAALAEIKVTAADTAGQLTIVEVTEPPGVEAPLHVHHREDEGFWILDGEVTLEVGDQTIEASAGDFAWGPRDVSHRYTVGPNGCRMLFICTPAGFENLVREMSVPAETRTLPPPSDEEPDMEAVAAVARRHGCELLG